MWLDMRMKSPEKVQNYICRSVVNLMMRVDKRVMMVRLLLLTLKADDEIQ
jgi:hypothetical protein